MLGIMTLSFLVHQLNLWGINFKDYDLFFVPNVQIEILAKTIFDSGLYIYIYIYIKKVIDHTFMSIIF